jgi:ubiquinone/menaquinone biosynthesis C-methylase UbiE
MDPTEFDKFAEEYYHLHAENIAISGENPEYFTEYKVRDLLQFVELNRSAGIPRILDFGAGIGSSVPFISQHITSAHITCVDVSLKSLRLGRLRCGRKAQFILFDGSRMPFRDGSFDVVFSDCVFHHIDHKEHVALLQELHRILIPGGIAVVYEHNPYNPVTRHVIDRCAFDKCAVLISAPNMRRRFIHAGFCNPAVHYRVFFPAAFRKLRALENWLRWLPLGAQYFVAARK